VAVSDHPHRDYVVVVRGTPSLAGCSGKYAESLGICRSALRALSLAGLLTTDFPFWLSIDRRQSDLPDLLFNEPLFWSKGCSAASLPGQVG
jgi:hypothetical protein